MQLYILIPSMQVPPLAHGLDSHSSSSACTNMKRDKQGIKRMKEWIVERKRKG